MRVWAEPFTALRIPRLFNLRTDPFERADITSNTYYDWFLYHRYMIYAAQTLAADFAATLKSYPPRQKAASFTIDQALEGTCTLPGGKTCDAEAYYRGTCSRSGPALHR